MHFPYLVSLIPLRFTPNLSIISYTFYNLHVVCLFSLITDTPNLSVMHLTTYTSYVCYQLCIYQHTHNVSYQIYIYQNAPYPSPQGRDNNENYFNVTFISICRSLHPNANNTKPRRITRSKPLGYICNCEYGAFMYHNVNQ